LVNAQARLNQDASFFFRSNACSYS
jgi:hypothetical protein